MSELVKVATAPGGLGLIRMTRPPVNALGQALRTAMFDAHAAHLADPGIKAIVITGTGRFFSAGADITEFDGKRRHPYLTELIAALEAGPKPAFALVNGLAYGGGLELALGCDHICVLPDARLALPEITLGNIPGAGGTQKLPRLIGGAEALRMILSGKPVDAATALRLGLASWQAETEAKALEMIAAQISAGLPRRRPRDQSPSGAPEELKEVAAPFLRRARGAPAPEKALDAVRMAYDTPIDDALVWEQKTFAALNVSPESQAMRYLFHAERTARKLDDLPAKTRPRPVASVGVVGAGTMGVGIALCCAAAGLKVTLLDQDAARLAQAVIQIRSTCQAEAARGRISPDIAQARIARIIPAQDFATLATADLVIEAVFEAMDVKHEVFSKLDAVCKSGAVLATNTSTLDVNVIADATSRPADVIGLHFFSPAHVMKLLEVVNADRTSPEVLATAMDFAVKLGKVAAVVGVCDGFAGNRMFMNFNREAQILVEEGALPEQVDRVLQDWGLAMGPLAVMDLAGLDVGYRIREARAPTRDPNDSYPFTTADRLVEAGRLGQKSRLGWYRYPEGSRTPEPDPIVTALIETVAAEKGITRRIVTDYEILERCLLQLVSTGFHLLDEGIVRRASDLDVILVNGYGFPRSKGGPMHLARQTGLISVAEKITRFHCKYGVHWCPAPLMLREAARQAG